MSYRNALQVVGGAALGTLNRPQASRILGDTRTEKTRGFARGERKS